MKKKFFVLTLVLALAVCLSALAACTQNKVSPVVITAPEVVEDGTTLKDYMDGQEKSGALSYVISDGMIVSINGTANTTNCYWMLYTSDAENSNTAWGTFTYEGETLGSATLGAESLVIKSGCIYVWVYQKF